MESSIQKTIRSSEANLIGNVDAVDEGQRGDQFIQALKAFGHHQIIMVMLLSLKESTTQYT